MKTLIIGFSRSNKIFSRLIQWATRSKISHTYLRFPTELEYPKFIVYQASSISVNSENFNNFQNRVEIVDEVQLEISEEHYRRISSYVLAMLGKPYSFKQLIGMIWVLLWRMVHIKVKNPFRDKDHSFVCVELVARALEIPGAEELSPQDLWELLAPVVAD